MAALWLAAWGAGYAMGRVSGDRQSSGRMQAVIDAFTAGRFDVPAGRTVLLRAWKAGQVLASCDIVGVRIPDGCVSAVSRALRQGAYVRLDEVVGSAPIVQVPVLRELSVRAGMDGLLLTDGNRKVYLTPEDLAVRGAYSGFRPFPFVKELHVGTDVKRMAASVMKPGGSGQVSVRRLVLVSRVYSGRELEPVFRMKLARRLGKVTPEQLRTLVKSGGDYMLRSLFTDRRRIPCSCRKGFFFSVPGQFLYQQNLINGRAVYQSRVFYNMPRHSGTTYSLANLTRVLGDGRFASGARRALEYLRSESVPCGPGLCVGRGTVVSLGSTALALVAASEYRLATGDSRFDDLMRAWASFLLFMRRDSGDFHHLYDRRAGRRLPDVLLYYSGEAAFALAKAYKVFRDDEYRDAAISAMDAITSWHGREIPFHFAFTAEHWTCQAAWELYPAPQTGHYLDYCMAYVKYIGRLQYGSDFVRDYPDIVGGFGVTSIYAPHLTPACSHAEALDSIIRLARARGEDDTYPREQLGRIVSFVVRHWIRGSQCWICKNPGLMDGAIPSSPTEWYTRIDFVQHCTTGMARALDLL